MILISLDPSMHSTGYAIFQDAALVKHGELKVPAAYTGIKACLEMWRIWENTKKPQADVVACEVQGFRKEEKEGASIDNLMMLNGICVSFLLGTPTTPQGTRHPYFPRDWKGTVPKPIMTRRLTKFALHPNPGHDELDAIGIGLHYLMEHKLL